MLQMALRDWIWFWKGYVRFSEERGSQRHIQLEIFNLTAENFKYKSHSSGSLAPPVFTIATAYSLKNWLLLPLPDNLYRCLCKLRRRAVSNCLAPNQINQIYIFFVPNVFISWAIQINLFSGGFIHLHHQLRTASASCYNTVFLPITWNNQQTLAEDKCVRIVVFQSCWAM